MTAPGDGGFDGVLAGQRLGRQGLDVKLDRGFTDGTYCVYRELRGRVRYVAVRRQLPGIHAQSAG